MLRTQFSVLFPSKGSTNRFLNQCEGDSNYPLYSLPTFECCEEFLFNDSVYMMVPVVNTVFLLVFECFILYCLLDFL